MTIPFSNDSTQPNDAAEAKAICQRLTATLPGLVYRVHCQENRMEFLNGQALAITGYSPEELRGGELCGLDPLIVDQDRAQVIREVRQAIADNAPFAVEYRLRHKDGSIRHLLERGIPINDPHGKPEFIDGVIFDITAQKRDEERIRAELTARVRELDEVQRLARLGSYIFDIRSGTFTTSAMMDEIFGIGAAYEHTVEGWARLIVADQRQEMRSYLERVIQERKRFEKEYRIVRLNDQAERWLFGTGEVEYDATGPVRMVGTIQDITERKRAEEQLREVSTIHEQIISCAEEGIVVYGPDLRYLVWNPFMEKISGRKAAEVLGRHPLEVFPFLSEVGLIARLKKTLQGEITPTIEFPNHSGFGQAGWTADSSVPLRNSEGTIIGVIGTVQDITERKQADIARRNSEKMLQAIIDTEPECVKLLDSEARVILMNRAGLAMIEVDDLEQVKGQCVCPMIAAGHWDAFMDLIKRVFRGESGTLVFEMIGAKGRHLWLETHAVPFRNEKEEIVALLGVTRDITAQRQAEEELIRSRERYRTLYDETPILMHSIDRNGRLVDVNNHWLRAMGYERDEVLGRRVVDFYTEASRQYALQVVQPAFFRDGACTDIALQLVKKSGEVIDVLLSATGERDAEGTVIRSRAVLQDVTDRHRLEAEQLKAQKMEAIGTLAGGIAHDFNNLLQGVFGFLSLAKLDIDNQEAALRALDQAEKALALTKQLSLQLLTFAKGGKPVKKPIQLQGVIRDSARFALSGSRCQSCIDLEGTLWSVEADEGQIGQVIQNIVLNADQAMPAGGKVEISAQNIRLPDPSLPLELPPGNYVAVAIRDNGPGIAAPHLTKIFDPYFTTKEMGSGLGLATSYSIVKNHDGLLTVSSAPGKGSCFSLYLPALEATAETGVRPERRPAARNGKKRGRILIMDDEEAIRDVAGQMLRAFGHEVEFAEQGEEAIAKYRQARERGQPFDVVILDLTIRGGMGGYETIRELLAIDPAVQAVVSSGYSSDSVLAEFRRHGFKACLNKPYSLKELRETMQELLAAR